MSRVLVIGGTLFIGRSLVTRLLDAGDEVVIMHRGTGTPFGDRVSEIQCDRNDIAGVRAALEGSSFDIVYDNVYDWQRGTASEQVAAAARAAASPRLHRYVFMSSIAAYGGGSDHDERDALAPPHHPDPYGRDKADSERALFALHREQGVPVATLRPAFIYGRGNPFNRETFFWDRIVAGRPVIIPGDGERLMQFAHVDDVARTAIAAAAVDAAVGSAYNIGNDPPITQVEFVRALARAARRDVELVHVPREQIEAEGGGLFAPPLYFGEYLDLPSLTTRVARVHSELGVELTPLDTGLRDTFLWYERQSRPPVDHAWEDRLLSVVR